MEQSHRSHGQSVTTQSGGTHHQSGGFGERGAVPMTFISTKQARKYLKVRIQNPLTKIPETLAVCSPLTTNSTMFSSVEWVNTKSPKEAGEQSFNVK